MAKTTTTPEPPTTQATTAGKANDPVFLIELKKDVGKHKKGERLYARPSQLESAGLQLYHDYRGLGTKWGQTPTFNP